MTQREFSTPGAIRVEIRVASGDFRVSTIDGEQSTVLLEGSQKVLDATRVELLGDRLVIEQRRKSMLTFFGSWEDSLGVTVRVPHGSSLEVTTASGDTVAEGSFAGLELTSASGDVRATGEIQGKASVKTTSGDARLSQVSGQLLVRTVSGDVEAESVGGPVSVRSVSGNMRAGLLQEGRVDVQSVSGDVALGIAPGTDVDVDVGTASGELTSEVPLSAERTAGGGPTVVIRGKTVSGDFRIFRAAAAATVGDRS
jgi:hypothetical protein